MKSALLVCFILIAFHASAQEAGNPPPPEIMPSMSDQNPAVRPLPPNDPNPESSSFMGDSQNIDPLRPRRESLKEDDEPVLEDIRQVLDAPKKSPKAAPPSAEMPSGEVSPTTSVEAVTEVPAAPAPSNSGRRKRDNPDAAIEKKFYNNYVRFNSEPTSAEVWSTAIGDRSAEVYIVQKGDTLWTISETLFGDSLFWPKIWAINRQGILNPHFITPGMRVNFYPGSESDVPTLGVGEEPADSDGTATKLSDSSEPTPLPASLPYYKSELYYGKPRQVEVVDLNEPQRAPVAHSTDILMTDRLVLSDIKISPEGNTVLNCKVGELIENFEFVRRTSTLEYVVLQPLPRLNPEKGLTLYPYRQVGKVTVRGEDQLIIKECHSYLNRDNLFIPIEILKGITTNLASTKKPSIIGGPAVRDQFNYIQEQEVYVDMGNLNFAEGQVFPVISRRIDLPIGHVKILKRFGSFGVGVISEASNVVQFGDFVRSR